MSAASFDREYRDRMRRRRRVWRTIKDAAIALALLAVAAVLLSIDAWLVGA